MNGGTRGDNAAHIGSKPKNHETRNAGPGTTLRVDYGLDRSSYNGPNENGKKLGGGRDNLSHSLNGASAATKP